MSCKYNPNGTIRSDIAPLTAVSTGTLTSCTASSKVLLTQDIFVQPFGSQYPPFSLPSATLAKYNILAYGGDPTNTLDNTGLINQLLLENSIVYMPKGGYRVDGQIQMPLNTKLVGDYNGLTSLIFTDETPGSTLINLNGYDTVVKDFQILYLGTSTDTAIFGGDGPQRARITDIQSDNTAADLPPIFAAFTGDSRVLIDNCTINVQGTNGVIASDTSRLILTNNTFIKSGPLLLSAVETRDTAQVVVANNFFGDYVITPPNLFILASGGSYISNNLISPGPVVFSGAGVADTMIFNDGTPGTEAEYSNVVNGLRVDGTKVIGARVTNAALANVPNSGDANTNALIAALRDIVVAHGLGQA